MVNLCAGIGIAKGSIFISKEKLWHFANGNSEKLLGVKLYKDVYFGSLRNG